jgi:hypothetical protein
MEIKRRQEIKALNATQMQEQKSTTAAKRSAASQWEIVNPD